MRFHHSTRRGRRRVERHNYHKDGYHGKRCGLAQSRLLATAYCRETNIHFNRPQLVSLPRAELRRRSLELPPLASYSNVCQAGNKARQWQQQRRRRQSCEETAEGRLEASSRPALSFEQVSSSTVPMAPSGEAAFVSLQQQRNRQKQASAQLSAELRKLNIDGDLKIEPVPFADTASIDGNQYICGDTNIRNQVDNEPFVGTNSMHCQLVKLNAGDEHHTVISMESARERLVSQVEKHPFWSNKAAKRMQLTSVTNRQVLFYEIASFCERRELEWRFEPYAGGCAQSVPFRKIEVKAPSAPDSPAADQSFASPYTARQQLEAASRANSLGESEPQTPVSVVTAQDEEVAGELAACYEPLSALNADEPSAELLWSIEPLARPEACFVTCISYCEVPNSSFVKRCHGCAGKGRLKCNSCHGDGYEVCLGCSGRGSTRTKSRLTDRRAPDAGSGGAGNKAGGESEGTGNGASRCKRDESKAWEVEPCGSCRGSGQKRCWICAGRAYTACPQCHGAKQLRCFQRLIVTWLTHKDELFVNNCDNIVPRDRLKLATGNTLLEESCNEMRPLLGDYQFEARPEGVAGALREPSRRLFEKHRKSLANERLIRQRHKVTQIDCNIVHYEWKQRRGHFVIYGEEKKVYIAKYPFKSICTIT